MNVAAFFITPIGCYKSLCSHLRGSRNVSLPHLEMRLWFRLFLDRYARRFVALQPPLAPDLLHFCNDDHITYSSRMWQSAEDFAMESLDVNFKISLIFESLPRMLSPYLLLIFVATLGATYAKSESLLLEAVLEPLNATHLKASIQNTYNQSISILGWNNHFQSSQNGAHGSFRVSYESDNSTYQVVQPAPNRSNFRFLKPVKNHFTIIRGRGWHTAIFDITELFDIPRQGEYNISMQFETQAILETKTNDQTPKNTTVEIDTQLLSRLIIKSQSEAMPLDASNPHGILRRRSNLGPCSENQKLMPTVLRARENARNLAKYAQNVSRTTPIPSLNSQ